MIEDDAPSGADLRAYSQLVEGFTSTAIRDRWGRALMVLGWVHLGFALVFQARYHPDGRGAPVSVALWVTEAALVVLTMRLSCGRGWHRAHPLAGVIARIWATYLILAFSSATLNRLTGFDLDWFKLAWCLLGTFGFATMAWLLSPWFLAPAVQLSLTALLMAHRPGIAYVFHGFSWWALLQALGLLLESRRARPRPRVAAEAEAEAEAELTGAAR